jgi:hypothetical protein
VFYDIESDTSAVNEKGQREHKAFLLCAHVDIEIIDAEGKPPFILFEEVVFKGTDCCVQFIRYII